MADMYSGTCFCGAVAIEASCEPVEMGYCHCHSCRHYSGAPLVAFTLWRADQVRVSRGAELLGRFNKAGMSERRFCTRCGGHVMIELAGFGFIDVYPDVLPGVAFLAVGPPELRRTGPAGSGRATQAQGLPSEAGGSGEVVPE